MNLVLQIFESELAAKNRQEQDEPSKEQILRFARTIRTVVSVKRSCPLSSLNRDTTSIKQSSCFGIFKANTIDQHRRRQQDSKHILFSG